MSPLRTSDYLKTPQTKSGPTRDPPRPPTGCPPRNREALPVTPPQPGGAHRGMWDQKSPGPAWGLEGIRPSADSTHSHGAPPISDPPKPPAGCPPRTREAPSPLCWGQDPRESPGGDQALHRPRREPEQIRPTPAKGLPHDSWVHIPPSFKLMAALDGH